MKSFGYITWENTNKKILALLVVVLLLLSVCPVKALSQSDEEKITNSLQSLQAIYPAGTEWTNTTPGTSYTWLFPGTIYLMSGCYSFSAKLQDVAFGPLPDCPVYWQSVNDTTPPNCMNVCPAPFSWDNLLPGDIIVFKSHAVIVLEKKDTGVYVAEGNYMGKVNWGRFISRYGIEQTARFIYTRWDKSDKTGSHAQWSQAAVQWADQSGILSNLTSAPNTACMRGEVMRSVWLLAGSPATSEDVPFTDVNPGSVYYDAVAWAYGAGVAMGMTDSCFSPNKTCTRAQVVTFLWRLSGSPAPAEKKGTLFSDVMVGKYYDTAVAWAYETGITNGTSNSTFSPSKLCTNAEVLTLLYRMFSPKQ